MVLASVPIGITLADPIPEQALNVGERGEPEKKT